MITLGILHESLAAQAQDYGLPDTDIVVTGANLANFAQDVLEHPPQVLVLDLDLLGYDPIAQLEALKQATKAQVVVVVYHFAKWSLIQKITTFGASIVKSPVNLRLLQTTFLTLMVKDAPTITAIHPQVAPQRYSKKQLAQLQQIQSVVNCECPNHMSELVLSLQAFEAYSHQCKNQNPKDAQVHTMLYQKTAEARALMEEALHELCLHENIVLDD